MKKGNMRNELEEMKKGTAGKPLRNARCYLANGNQGHCEAMFAEAISSSRNQPREATASLRSQ
jgi:hypothetical protein